MSNFRDYSRSQRFLLPPDLKDWVADDDLAHFIVEAVERVDMSAFHVSRTGSGKAQYHPRMMLGLLVYCYAIGIFSSRRIEQASYRHVSVRFIAANTHPDHDTIATFRRRNGGAFAAAFEQVLLLASAAGLLKVGTVSVDGTKIDANASKIKSIRYDRIQALFYHRRSHAARGGFSDLPCRSGAPRRQDAHKRRTHRSAGAVPELGCFGGRARIALFPSSHGLFNRKPPS